MKVKVIQTAVTLCGIGVSIINFKINWSVSVQMKASFQYWLGQIKWAWDSSDWQVSTVKNSTQFDWELCEIIGEAAFAF